MKDYSIELYQPEFKSEWDDFVINSKNGTFLIRRDFMEYHQDRFEDFSLLVFKDKKLIALLPANKVGEEIHSHQGLTYGGLILSKTIKFDSVLHCYHKILEFLIENGITSLYIKEIPVIYHQHPSDELRYLNFILTAKLVRRDILSVIDNQCRLAFSNSRQEGVKRGKKHHLTILDDEGLELFWNTILIPNLKNKHNAVPVHSLEEISHLKKKFSNSIKQYNVYHDNRLVAGATIFETDQVAHCQYISGDEDKNRLGSLDFLHDYLINEVYPNKRYFDFGSSNESQGHHINQGLQFWKEGFGARTFTQDFLKIATANYVKLKLIYK